MIDAGQVVIKLIADTGGYKTEILGAGNVSDNAFNGIAKGANLVGNAIKMFLGVMAVKSLADLGYQAIVTAGEVAELEVVNRRLGRNAGITQDVIRAQTQAVKEMGIESKAANQAIAKFVQAGLDVTKTAKLARVAQDAAVISQTNSSEAFDRLVHGVTTLNPLILRQMGIIVDSDIAYKNYAASIGKAAGELSYAEKQQAFLNATIEQGTRIAGIYEEAMTQPTKVMRSWPRYFEDIKEAIGAPFQPIFLDVVTNISETLKNLPAELGPVFTDIKNGIMQAFGIAKEGKVGILGSEDVMPETGPLQEFGETAKNVALSVKSIYDNTKLVTGAVFEMVGGWETVSTVVDNIATVIGTIADGIGIISKVLGGDTEGAQTQAEDTRAKLQESGFGQGLGKAVTDSGIGTTMPGINQLQKWQINADMLFEGGMGGVAFTDRMASIGDSGIYAFNSRFQESVPQFNLLGIDIGNSFSDGFTSLDIGNFIGSEASGWVNAAKGHQSEFQDVGLMSAKGIAAGIGTGTPFIEQAAREAIRAAIAAAKAEAQVHSPSRVFMEIGGNLMKGLAIGVDNDAGLAVNSVTSVMRDISSVNADGLGGERANQMTLDSIDHKLDMMPIWFREAVQLIT